MIEFTCPGCLSRCVANGVFAGMRARCVVCGAFIRIPAETGTTAFPLGPVPTGPLPDRRPKVAATASKSASKPPKPTVRPRAGTGLVTLSDPDAPAAPETTSAPATDSSEPVENNLDSDMPLAIAPPTNRTLPQTATPATSEKKPETKPKKEKEGKKKAKKAKPSGSELDGKLNWEDFGGEEPPPESPPEAPKSRKRQMLIIGGSVVAALVITGVLAFSGGEKPKLPAPVDNSGPPDPPQQPPAKPPEPKKEEKKDPPPPPPRIEVIPHPRSLENPNNYVVAQLIAERAANPITFDSLHRGQLFILRGTFARTSGGTVYLAEGAADERVITCAPPRIHKKGPLEFPPEVGLLQPGQAVLVRGWYAGDLSFTDCRVVPTTGPADAEYRDKTVELVGRVANVAAVDADNTERFPSIVLEPTSTDCPVIVRCLFRPTEREKLTALKAGETVTIRGRCEGRSYRIVRLHDSALVPNTEQLSPDVPRVQAEQFFAAYEVDLLHYERPNPMVPPISATAERLAAAYGTDLSQANATYQYKTVAVTGKVTGRQAGLITLETGTSQKYQVSARFTPRAFATVKDTPSLTITGTCVGLVGKDVRLENASAVDPDAGNFAIRITPDYFPRQPGRELVYDLLTPGATRDSLTRIDAKFTEGELLQLTTMRTGTFSKPSLFSDPPGVPKWSSGKPKGATRTTEFRLNEDMLEMRDKPAPPLQPGTWWDPILKFGARKGDTWNSTLPDGRTLTYTVVRFGKDSADRNTVEIQRVLKNPKETGSWDETTITYARGVGEVRRVLTKQSTNGKSFTTLEMKLVEGESPLPPGPAPKKEADPKKEPKPKKDPEPEPKNEPAPPPSEKTDKKDKKDE